MVVPLVVWGVFAGASALGVGSYFGLKGQEPDKITNITNQDSYQYDYITNETIFDLSNAYFEDGSRVDLSNYANVETSKSSSQKAEQSGATQDKTMLYLIIAAAAIGGYLYFKRA